MRTCASCGHQWTATVHVCPECGQLPEGLYGEHLPSEDDIKRLTAEIRSKWSATERQSRARWAFTDPMAVPSAENLAIHRVNRKDARHFE